MDVTFDKEDIMKALNIYMILRGYKTDGHFDFRWRNELLITTNVESLNTDVSYEDLKKYAKR